MFLCYWKWYCFTHPVVATFEIKAQFFCAKISTEGFQCEVIIFTCCWKSLIYCLSSNVTRHTACEYKGYFFRLWHFTSFLSCSVVLQGKWLWGPVEVEDTRQFQTAHLPWLWWWCYTTIFFVISALPVIIRKLFQIYGYCWKTLPLR